MRVLTVFLVFCFMSSIVNAQPAKREFYQLTVYRFANSEQEKSIDQYLEKAWLPALSRQKINQVGVFKPIANDTSAVKSIYVLVPLKSTDQLVAITDLVQTDKQLQEDGKEYLQAAHNSAPFQRMEVSLLKAFQLAPKMKLPKLAGPKSDRVYEFRSYESATEKLYRNKVKMFNEGGEVTLFERLQFNAIFYAETIAGSRMPNLVYMTSFENMEERNKHWKSFSADEEWKKLSAMPEYKNNVSRNETILMRAAEYSTY